MHKRFTHLTKQINCRISILSNLILQNLSWPPAAQYAKGMNVMDFYSLTAQNAQGEEVPFSQYKGKVLLVVNTATGCGFTPQYAALQQLYGRYNKEGFEILDFPCNQFGHQAPGTAGEISSFCQLNYGVTFPQFAKIEVNGKKESPVYSFLKKESPGVLGGAIKWNFTKFLISRTGKVVGRYAPTAKPEDLAGEIEKLLAQ